MRATQPTRPARTASCPASGRGWEGEVRLLHGERGWVGDELDYDNKETQHHSTSGLIPKKIRFFCQIACNLIAHD